MVNHGQLAPATRRGYVNSAENGRECAAIVAAKLGYDSLYEKQEDILVKFMSRCDVFGVLPTGRL